MRPRATSTSDGHPSKAFASCGGYIAGRTRWSNIPAHAARVWPYSVGMTPANAAAALAAARRVLPSPNEWLACTNVPAISWRVPGVAAWIRAAARDHRLCR